MQLKTLLNHYEGQAIIKKGDGILDASVVGYIHSCADIGFYVTARDYDNDADEANDVYEAVSELLSAKVVQCYMSAIYNFVIIVK